MIALLPPSGSIARRLALRLAACMLVVALAALGGIVLHTGQVVASHPGELVHEVLREFFLDMAWTLPLIVALVAWLGILAVHGGLRPLAEVAARAQTIAPGRVEARLGVAGVPLEIRPLVEAMDGALARLAEGYEVQRRFTATAAHELRTPLAVLRAGLERLEPSPEVLALRRDAERMGRIVAQLLELARIEGRPPAANAVDLAETARALASDRAPAALARGVRIAFEGPTRGVPVAADRAAFEAIASNLLDNAVAHAPEGSEVVVRVAPAGRLEVLDQGPGVPTEHQARMFERFWRGPGAPGDGAGLGLAIVAEAVRAARGTIAVDSAPGRGTRLEVTFGSLAPAAATPAGEGGRSPRPGDRRPGGALPAGRVGQSLG